MRNPYVTAKSLWRKMKFKRMEEKANGRKETKSNPQRHCLWKFWGNKTHFCLQLFVWHWRLQVHLNDRQNGGKKNFFSSNLPFSLKYWILQQKMMIIIQSDKRYDVKKTSKNSTNARWKKADETWEKKNKKKRKLCITYHIINL